MAERYRLIRFDPRGIGLSGDPPGGWGAESATGVQAGMSTREMGLDIEAVSKALELDSFVLMAIAVQGRSASCPPPNTRIWSPNSSCVSHGRLG